MRSIEAIREVSRRCRVYGIAPPPLTKDEKRRAHGGLPHPSVRYEGYDAELVRRYEAGLHLSKADRKAARAAISKAKGDA